MNNEKYMGFCFWIFLDHSYPPPTTTRVNSRPAGLRPQVKTRTDQVWRPARTEDLQHIFKEWQSSKGQKSAKNERYRYIAFLAFWPPKWPQNLSLNWSAPRLGVLKSFNFYVKKMLLVLVCVRVGGKAVCQSISQPLASYFGFINSLRGGNHNYYAESS